MRKRLALVLKALLTFLLLLALVLQMDIREFIAILAGADLSLLVLATLIQVGITLIAVLRWQVILANFDIATGFSPLTKITFIGQFFNLFLPSAIGGDFFRAYYLSRHEHRGMSTTLTTTLLERSAGLFALLVIGCLFAFLHRVAVQGVSLLYVFIGLITTYTAANVALFNAWFHRGLTRLFARFRLADVDKKLELVYQGLCCLRSNRRAVVHCLLLSFAIQFISVVIMWLAALSIQIEAPFYVFLIFIPIVNLTIMIPLTINGFGLRESIYYLLFSQIGLPVETSVTLALLNFLIVTLASLPGGVAYSLYKKEDGFDNIVAKPETL
jgi:glycosyltransferase 2 family protein